MRTVYNESFGTLSFAQRSAYRKHNVTPAEHMDLIDHFGEGNHGEITQYVKAHLSPTGSYDPPWNGRFA